jgi:hypothetical protein
MLNVVANASATVGAVIKGASGQTENLQVWQNSGANTLARVSANGSIATASNLAVGLTAITNANQFQVTATSATQVGAVIRGAASQSADLLQIQNSAGGTVAKITSSGDASFGAVALGNGTIYGSSSWLNIGLTNATQIGAIVKGAASQSANLQEWQNSGGTVLASISSAGASNFASVVASGTSRAGAGLGSSTVALSSLVSNVAGGHLVLQNITVTPNTPSGAGVLYVESGALKYRGSSGTITILGAA